VSHELNEQMVQRVARLARLKLSPSEVARFSGQLQQVLHYVEQLNEVNCDGIEPMAHPIEVTNVFRADEPRESLPRTAALANAPKTDSKYFLVPPILDEK
jgi:aspartyl-tRNA(Asn)/glutamyl-tRNA(Gln) amidotransferase subunit C